MDSIASHPAAKVETAAVRNSTGAAKVKIPTRTKILRAVVTIALILSIVGIIFLGLASAGIGGSAIFGAIGAVAQGTGALLFGRGKNVFRELFGHRESPTLQHVPLPEAAILSDSVHVADNSVSVFEGMDQLE